MYICTLFSTFCENITLYDTYRLPITYKPQLVSLIQNIFLFLFFNLTQQSSSLELCVCKSHFLVDFS